MLGFAPIGGAPIGGAAEFKTMSGVVALLNQNTSLVENVIMADVGDPVPDGFLLIANPAEFVEIGTVWDGNDFVRPADKPTPNIPNQPMSRPPISANGLEML